VAAESELVFIVFDEFWGRDLAQANRVGISTAFRRENRPFRECSIWRRNGILQKTMRIMGKALVCTHPFMTRVVEPDRRGCTKS